MVKGKTATGFVFSTNPKKIKDVRFLKSMRKMRKDNDGTELLEMLPMLLDDDQVEALYKHCEKDGVCDIDDVSAEFVDIIQQLAQADETKN